MTDQRPHAGGRVRRPRIFLLEERPLISLALSTAAEELGWEVVGPMYRLSPEVMELAEQGDIDVAIIDLVLSNGISDRIIRTFQTRSVPVIVSSGLMVNAVRHVYPGVEILGKPHTTDELRGALSRLLPLAAGGT